MPVYNGEKYIREAIDSILAQTFTDFELIVVDDGSADRSVEIIQTYMDRRIRVLKNQAEPGVIGARNTGLSQAQGEFIALMDCDDIALPERLSEQVAFLDDHPDFGLVGAGIEVINEDGRPTGQVGNYTLPAELIPALLLFYNYFAQSAVVIRKAVLPEEHYRLYPGTEDYDLWVRLARRAKVWNLQKVLVRYRVHASSLSFAKARAIDGYINEIVRYQLHDLGLLPNVQDIEMHRKIGDLDFLPDGGVLREAEAWLMKLRSANAKANVYNNGSFGEVLGKEWYDVCINSSELGIAAWTSYWQSPLSRLYHLNMPMRSYFFISSVLKLNRKTRAKLKHWAITGAERLGLSVFDQY
jgi:glycosyltransferase involved in cell wall biosynthesis